MKPSTGEVFDYGNPCRSFTHQPCAEKRVGRLLDHIGPFLFNSTGEIWVAAGEYDDGLANRMRVRRNKAKDESGEPVHALWVRRNTGVFYYFATAELAGRAAPQTGQWLNSEDAYVVARAALTVPGVGDVNGRKGINFSKGWRLGAEPNRSEGLLRIGQGDQIATAVAAEAARRLGVGPASQPHWGYTWQKPDGLDLTTWNAMVELVAEEIEADVR